MPPGAGSIENSEGVASTTSRTPSAVGPASATAPSAPPAASGVAPGDECT